MTMFSIILYLIGSVETCTLFKFSLYICIEWVNLWWHSKYWENNISAMFVQCPHKSWRQWIIFAVNCFDEIFLLPRSPSQWKRNKIKDSTKPYVCQSLQNIMSHDSLSNASSLDANALYSIQIYIFLSSILREFSSSPQKFHRKKIFSRFHSNFWVNNADAGTAEPMKPYVIALYWNQYKNHGESTNSNSLLSAEWHAFKVLVFYWSKCWPRNTFVLPFWGLFTIDHNWLNSKVNWKAIKIVQMVKKFRSSVDVTTNSTRFAAKIASSQ